MRSSLWVLLTAAILLPASHGRGLAQWTSNKVDVHGSFGDRSLGRTLNPAPSRMFDGLLRGRSGDFRGRGRPEGGMVFGAWTEDSGRLRYGDAAAGRRPWTAPPQVGPSDVIQTPRPRTVAPAAEMPRPSQAAQPPEVAPPPERARPVEEIRPPDVWFRSAPSGGNPGANFGTGSPLPWRDVSPPRAWPAQTRLAPPLQIGFAPAGPADGPGTGRAAALAGRIGRCKRIRTTWPITVTVEHQTAILRGSVATEHDRRLVEDFARFEPGIWKVRNELSVASGPPISAASAATE